MKHKSKGDAQTYRYSKSHHEKDNMFERELNYLISNAVATCVEQHMKKNVPYPSWVFDLIKTYFPDGNVFFATRKFDCTGQEWFVVFKKKPGCFDLTVHEEFEKVCHYTNLVPEFWYNIAKDGINTIKGEPTCQ
jgi:hypothetical protein